MFKQLVHYLVGVSVDQADPQVVKTSPDLQTPEQITAWESQAHIGLELPTGRQWGIVPDNHAWFDDSKLPALAPPTVQGGKLLTPEEVLLLERTPQMRNRFKEE